MNWLSFSRLAARLCHLFAGGKQHCPQTAYCTLHFGTPVGSRPALANLNFVTSVRHVYTLSCFISQNAAIHLPHFAPCEFALTAKLIAHNFININTSLWRNDFAYRNPYRVRCDIWRNYSKIIFAFSHCSRTSSGQMLTCTSPICAFCSKSIHNLDCPIPPPIVSGSSFAIIPR